jgi:hypothetical protein
MPAWWFHSGAPCHTLPGRVGERGGVNRAYDLARFEDCWRRRRGGALGGVEQGDEADEGRLEAMHGMVGGLFRGRAGTKDQGRRSRPSQLIPRVLRLTVEER